MNSQRAKNVDYIKDKKKYSKPLYISILLGSTAVQRTVINLHDISNAIVLK